MALSMRLSDFNLPPLYYVLLKKGHPANRLGTLAAALVELCRRDARFSARRGL